MTTDAKIQTLLQEIGPGQVDASAYDTAWVARLYALDPTLANEALAWLCEHQLPDGSWGASEPRYFHDRVINTLAALVALQHRGRRAADRKRRERGGAALALMLQGLATDLAGAPSGFELLVPTLIKEGRQLGLEFTANEHWLDQLARKRAAKLAALPANLINRHYTPAYSLEMVGVDGLRLIDVDNILEANGSVACNPAATAFFLLHVQAEPRALAYLRAVTQAGAVPGSAPMDVFEVSWSLWNLALAGLDAAAPGATQHLDFLRRTWQPGAGIAALSPFSSRDGDTTAFVYDTLARYGRAPDIETVLHFEAADHFRSFALETHPSLSTNVHVLGALHQAGLPTRALQVQKAVSFLRAHRRNAHWHDKWHISPYYTTAHAVINCLPTVPALATEALEWIRATQRPNGAWGYFMPTAEETAYCLQALLAAGAHPSHELQHALDWLEAHQDPPYPSLWMGKVLYCPSLIVRSAILSALKMAGR